jgi:hypothetical protein
MGLLDALFSGDTGGLLDLIRSNGMNQQPMQGLPSDQAQYGQQASAMAPTPIFQQNQQNPIDTAQWPAGPVGAPSQANAQMPPQQPPPVIQQQPQAPQDASMGLGDRLGMGFRGMAANMAGGPIGALMGGIAGVAGMGQGNPANATAKALLAKGVDPATVSAAISNPELMKTLITQTYGPQTVQSLGEGYIADKSGKVTRAYQPEKTPMSIGNGYIYDPRTKQTTRAYEPEDKIPAGFVKGDDGNMHYIPGGPADPAYIQLAEAKKKDPNGVYTLGRGGELYKIDEKGNPVIVHKNETAQPEATLDDPTVSAMAGQYLAGDRTVMQNLGRGAQGAANIVKLRTEIYKQAQSKGLDGVGIVDNFNEQAGALAGQRAVGTRAANISLAANEANNMIDVAVKASEAVPRTQYVPINKAIQAVQTGSSSPQLASFVAATNSLVNAYVRAVSPSGVPTDSMREHAYSMLNSAQSHEAYMSVIGTMRKEMDAALKAPGQVREELRRTKTEGGGNKPEQVKIDGYTITAH